MRALPLCLAGLTALGLGCASTPSPTPTGDASADAVIPADAAAPPAPRMLSLPDERPRDPIVRLMSEGRYTLTVQNADLVGVLLGLAHDLPINVIVEPGVRGTVDADLKNVSLLDLLQQLVVARGYQYRIEGRTVRVLSGDRVTRTWQIDYPSTRQVGASTFSISGAVAQSISSSDSSSGGDSGGGGSQSQDTSTSGISTELALDFWSEVERGVRHLVDGDVPTTVEADPAAVDSAPATSSSSVLVSRQAGLLVVTAPEATLEEVDRHLALITRSLGRQVLIDTKIVEVTLGDDLDLGLDVEISPDLDSADGQHPIGTIVRAITGGLARDNAIASSDLAPVLTSGGFSFGIATDTVGVTLAALALQTDVRVVSTPRIATLNNHKAIVRVVRNEVYFIAETEVSVIANVGQSAVTTFTPSITPVGVTLDVTPQIAENGDVTLHVHPSVSEIVEIREQPLVEGQTAG
ncbi:MAG: hypothetical protein FJ108_17230, partial [Deltaproteobacteria bacterium]|nr:hypothetical protein [Deltaproteobacteria bacterium]